MKEETMVDFGIPIDRLKRETYEYRDPHQPPLKWAEEFLKENGGSFLALIRGAAPYVSVYTLYYERG